MYSIVRPFSTVFLFGTFNDWILPRLHVLREFFFDPKKSAEFTLLLNPSDRSHTTHPHSSTEDRKKVGIVKGSVLFFLLTLITVAFGFKWHQENQKLQLTAVIIRMIVIGAITLWASILMIKALWNNKETLKWRVEPITYEQGKLMVLSVFYMAVQLVIIVIDHEDDKFWWRRAVYIVWIWWQAWFLSSSIASIELGLALMFHNLTWLIILLLNEYEHVEHAVSESPIHRTERFLIAFFWTSVDYHLTAIELIVHKYHGNHGHETKDDHSINTA